MVRNNWQLFIGELDKSLCESIVENFSKLPDKSASTFNNAQDYRSSKIRWVEGEQQLKSHLMQYIHQANAAAFQININQIMTEMQFTEYDADYGGKYDWHHDVDWQSHQVSDRKLSMVVQLSDPESYDGGDLEFSEVQQPVLSDLRKQGSVIIFPSYLQHRVTEVTRGKRFSLVSWVGGPRWR